MRKDSEAAEVPYPLCVRVKPPQHAHDCECGAMDYHHVLPVFNGKMPGLSPVELNKGELLEWEVRDEEDWVYMESFTACDHEPVLAGEPKAVEVELEDGTKETHLWAQYLPYRTDAAKQFSCLHARDTLWAYLTDHVFANYCKLCLEDSPPAHVNKCESNNMLIMRQRAKGLGLPARVEQMHVCRALIKDQDLQLQWLRSEPTTRGAFARCSTYTKEYLPTVQLHRRIGEVLDIDWKPIEKGGAYTQNLRLRMNRKRHREQNAGAVKKATRRRKAKKSAGKRTSSASYTDNEAKFGAAQDTA